MKKLKTKFHASSINSIEDSDDNDNFILNLTKKPSFKFSLKDTSTTSMVKMSKTSNELKQSQKNSSINSGEPSKKRAVRNLLFGKSLNENILFRMKTPQLKNDLYNEEIIENDVYEDDEKFVEDKVSVENRIVKKNGYKGRKYLINIEKNIGSLGKVNDNLTSSHNEDSFNKSQDENFNKNENNKFIRSHSHLIKKSKKLTKSYEIKILNNCNDKKYVNIPKLEDDASSLISTNFNRKKFLLTTNSILEDQKSTPLTLINKINEEKEFKEKELKEKELKEKFTYPQLEDFEFEKDYVPFNLESLYDTSGQFLVQTNSTLSEQEQKHRMPIKSQIVYEDIMFEKNFDENIKQYVEKVGSLSFKFNNF